MKSYIIHYYSFKTFPLLWLAKSTDIFHTDDQIWKNFVFNEKMTLKMQPATG